MERSSRKGVEKRMEGRSRMEKGTEGRSGGRGE
jgi:hypothetical protein